MTGQDERAAQTDPSTEEGHSPQYWVPTWNFEALRAFATAIAIEKEHGDITRAARRCGDTVSSIASIAERSRVSITGELKARWNLPLGRKLLFAVVTQEAARRGAKVVPRCSSDEALTSAIHEVMASVPSDPVTYNGVPLETAPAPVADPAPSAPPDPPPPQPPVVTASGPAPIVGSNNGHGTAPVASAESSGVAEPPEDDEPVPAAAPKGPRRNIEDSEPFGVRNQEALRTRALERYGIPTFRVSDLIKLAVRRATTLHPGSEQAAARLLGWTPDHLRKKLREDPSYGRELREDPMLPTLDLLELSRRAYLAARVVYRDDIHGIGRLVHKDALWVLEVPKQHPEVLARLSSL